MLLRPGALVCLGSGRLFAGGAIARRARLERGLEEVGVRIYVGNLSHDTSMDALRAFFAAHGEVKEVYLPTEAGTGRPRGFGFVEMPIEDEARVAVAATNGSELGGRTLNVGEARPRTESGDDRGYGTRY